MQKRFYLLLIFSFCLLHLACSRKGVISGTWRLEKTTFLDTSNRPLFSYLKNTQFKVYNSDGFKLYVYGEYGTILKGNYTLKGSKYKEAHTEIGGYATQIIQGTLKVKADSMLLRGTVFLSKNKYEIEQLYRPATIDTNNFPVAIIPNTSTRRFDGNKVFKSSLAKGKIKYKKPAGYNVKYLNETTHVGQITFGDACYQLQSKIDAVAIVFKITLIDTTDFMSLHRYDTRFTESRPGINRFSKEEAREYFNADEALSYTVRVLNGKIYAGKYDKCKSISFKKKGRATIDLNYFYSGDESVVNKHIKKTSKMLKFID